MAETKKSSIRASRSVLRRARSAGRRRPSPATRLDARVRPPGSGGAARGTEPHPGTGPGAGASRPDAGLAVHVLPGRRQDHGRRSEGHAPGRPRVQLCGDAHLSNFGVFASPERTLLFDLNDFDETLPGPFEYDVKRMAASFTIAARNNAFTKEETRDVDTHRRSGLPRGDGRVRTDGHPGHLVRPSVRGTADGSHRAGRGNPEGQGPQEGSPRHGKRRAKQNVAKAHTRDSLQALSKLAERVDGEYRIVSQPPIVIPVTGAGRIVRHVCRWDSESGS